MVGLCGTIGDTRNVDDLIDDLQWTGDEQILAKEDEEVAIASVVHPSDAGLGYAETEDGDQIWLWGTVWGFDGLGGYKSHPEGGAELCATLYAQYGIEFVGGLNGNFVGAIRNCETERVSLFTDRLGTRPLHLAITDNGVVFSTKIQSLPLHPGVETKFDEGYLGEYLAFNRTYGVKTPLTGIEKTQPGSITVLDANGKIETTRYWKPVYAPLDRPRKYFVDQLARTFRDVIDDRTEQSTDYGLLLSGGSDSRLVLAAFVSLGLSVETFHLTDWRNREAKIAEQVATAADVPFTPLRRDREYQARALAMYPQLSNFGGYFNQIHAGGFSETLTSAVDVLFTGHYGDMLFKGNHLRTPTVDLGSIGSFDLSFEWPITDIKTFIEHRADVNSPSYLQLPRNIQEIYRDNVRVNGNEIIDHGVAYSSLREATLASRCPLTNGSSQFFYYGTAQMMPSGTPFLDNRLIDLFLSIPIQYLLRGDLINAATERLAPALSEIPHGSGMIPVKYPFALQRAGELATSFVQRHFLNDLQEPHWTHGPWPDHPELIRTHEFVREVLNENEATIRALPFLSWEGVNECYEAHLAGEERMSSLYTLVTFLEMPVVDRLMECYVGR
ncbi:asparagine synthase-related protein [Haladaptatus pallidirubidus]|uniref:Asparagine synthase n=1 Tax=Haladaptatus pallidirubidus TaxID=1008152 RepID=A0AAV3UI92_9EURY|nr:asparagine synthase-related protein [Haladaptatus pallidirubidus]